MILIIERIKTGLKKRKVKVFLLFLVFSGLAWLINNLSQSFVSNTTFMLEYVNTPQELLLNKKPRATINVRLKAVGFQFVGFEIRKRKVQIDLSKVNVKDNRYYVLPKVYRRQIENQLPNSMEVLELENDTLFIDFIVLVAKKVHVIPRTTIDLANNYMLDGPIIVAPSMVTIRGPKSEVDSITSIRTSFLDIENITDDFSQEHALVLHRELTKSTVTPSSVTISGKVFRFSEKVVSAPITMINVPDSIKVRMFPDHVKVLCQGTIKALKSLDISDFKINADYEQIEKAADNRLPLRMEDFPENLSNATLLIKEVEFILRRE
ncbi:CdaR family protein [Maribacter antarcticus]|uniref:CdaR family protein n=1 Tax=Maribacter antarcticus TaxID=505250 RepID=UPI00047D2B49|nr:CdaR family protein [Maribacter antarcticus]